MELIRHSGKNFFVHVYLDQYNRRLWVDDYETGDPGSMRGFLLDLALMRRMEKIILPAREGDEKKLQGEGFFTEGVIRGYFNGTDAHFLAAFPSAKRAESSSLAEEKKMLQDILRLPRERKVNIPAGFSLRQAAKTDVLQIAGLFRKVFATYPSPVFDPDYLSRAMDRGDIYMVVYHGSRLAGAAAAETRRDQQRAELTNCATDPGYRGMGLNTLLLARIEKDCLSRGINCLYSLARASSYGMNLVLHRLGYIFGGSLVNNCHIDGAFENMNIWYGAAKK